MARISPDRGPALFPATMLMCVSRGAGRQISSLTCRLAARGTGALRVLHFRSAPIHCKRFQHRGHREHREDRSRICFHESRLFIPLHFFSVTSVGSLLNLSVETIFRKYPARGRYFLRLWGIRFFYWMISAASETTRSAIARHDVSPGDSIPINWMARGTAASLVITKSATPPCPGGTSFARIPE